MSESTPPPRASILPGWIAGALVVVIALQVLSAWQTREALSSLDATAARLEKAAIETEQVARRVQLMDNRLRRVEIVADEWEFLVDDVQKANRQIGDLVAALEGRGDVDLGEVPQPPELDWTEPELFAAAQRAAETVGITLTDDEVRVPARFLRPDGILEYFAVLKGGKEHEALVSVVGNLDADERRPRDFGAKLNNAIQALGFQRGRPIRFTPNGTRPAQGVTIHLVLEWLEEDGEPVLVRAEDLVWDRVRDRPMPSGTWVYVGSNWVEGDEPGELLFAADLTAELAATYSAVNTIIDTTAEGAQDDTVFLVATPRIPLHTRDCTLVIRRTDREPTRTFEVPAREGGDE
jgi:hypothetical protein